MSKPFAGKNVVVLGATGVIAYGAVHNFLVEGATVVAVGREKKRLEEFAGKMKHHAKNLILVPFENYLEEKGAENLRETVLAALPTGAKIDHVVTNLGWQREGGVSPLKSGVKDLQAAFETGLYPNIVAAQAFLPLLAERDGTSFATVSGGYAHNSNKGLLPIWATSVVNGAKNSLFVTLKVEMEGTKVRVGNFCVHFGVTYPDSDTNQMGHSGRNTNDLGVGFTLFAGNTSIESADWCLALPEAEKDTAAAVKRIVGSKSTGHGKK